MADVDLTGRVAVVTGAASGIGRAIAEDLAGHGARVVVGDLNEADGRAVAMSLPEGVFQRADISQRDDCRALIEQAVQTWGRLDILVNNAGLQFISPVEEFPEDLREKLAQVERTDSTTCSS